MHQFETSPREASPEAAGSTRSREPASQSETEMLNARAAIAQREQRILRLENEVACLSSALARALESVREKEKKLAELEQLLMPAPAAASAFEPTSTYRKRASGLGCAALRTVTDQHGVPLSADATAKPATSLVPR